MNTVKVTKDELDAFHALAERLEASLRAEAAATGDDRVSVMMPLPMPHNRMVDAFDGRMSPLPQVYALAASPATEADDDQLERSALLAAVKMVTSWKRRRKNNFSKLENELCKAVGLLKWSP